MKNWNYSKIANNYDQYSIYEDINPSKDIANSVEGEDNAKLISAAPDLLEACSQAEEELYNMLGVTEYDDKLLGVIRIIQSAKTKAIY